MAKKIQEFLGTGRRKRAVASIRLRPGGTGRVNVNGKESEEYFTQDVQRRRALSPLEKLELMGQYDLIIRCKGGGEHGQIDAVRLGIARALVAEVAERRQELKALGYLRRDPRRRERKKYGHKKARKSFQFSKR